MSVCIDVAYRSLNKDREELCGDKVEIVKTLDSDILILADGMGSGVKANILATLTSTILATMLKEGADIHSCVETIARTLPICQEREISYATFSVLQIMRSGEAHLVEYDNPLCVFVRDGEIVDYPWKECVVGDKKLREYHFQCKKNDCFVLMSDGVIYAGAGQILDMNGWTWENMAAYTLRCTKTTLSAARLSAMLSEACREFYEGRPGDDTTVAVARVKERRVLNIFSGPPRNPEDDTKLMDEFMAAEGIKVVSGGTSANIAARYLGVEVETVFEQTDTKLPPRGMIRGIDLVTEGVITMGKVLDMLEEFDRGEFDVEFFRKLDVDNGAAKLTKMILEECTDIRIFVGTAKNEAYQAQKMPFRYGIRSNLVKQLEQVVRKLGKIVEVRYY